jgi:hypothetical protein
MLFNKSWALPPNGVFLSDLDFARWDDMLGLSASHRKVVLAKDIRAEDFWYLIDVALAMFD